MLHIRPSLRIAAVAVGLHLLAAGCAWAALHGWALTAVLTGLAVSGGAVTADILQLHAGSAVLLELRDDGRGRWTDRGGSIHVLESVRPGCALPGLLVFQLRGAGRGRWLVLAADSAVAQELHRLRLWLRWHPLSRGS